MNITENKIGTQDGYDYELWKDRGITSMTLKEKGTFSCSWSEIGNALFRKGQKYAEERNYKEIGYISVDYGVDYQPEGNSYLCVYGWLKDPLVEYYVVESWGNWRPPGAKSKGQISIDGAIYDVYETTRENQPSILGTKTFQQYWSVRSTKRTSGTISLNEHFKAWEALGMEMGTMYETALTIEGYESKGYADVYKNELIITPFENDLTWEAAEQEASAESGLATGTKVVALTFDDGPTEVTTPQVLDILEEQDVVATFFLIGNQINDSTKGIMQRQLDLGCELANHSYTHAYLNQKTAEGIREEISRTNEAIKAAVGVDVTFFRPPYIAVNELMYETIDMPFIQGIMCNDWMPNVSAEERARMILDNVQDGSIILLHDLRGNTNTVQALPQILKGLKEAGYTLVTLSKLFENRGVNPKQKNRIWSQVK